MTSIAVSPPCPPAPAKPHDLEGVVTKRAHSGMLAACRAARVLRVPTLAFLRELVRLEPVGFVGGLKTIDDDIVQQQLLGFTGHDGRLESHDAELWLAWGVIRYGVREALARGEDGR